MIQEHHQKVLDHWRGIIGARSGVLTVCLGEGSDCLSHVELLPGPCEERGGHILACHVANDWEAVFLVAQFGREYVGSFVVARLPPQNCHVLEMSSDLVLVEESTYSLPVYRTANGTLELCVTIECTVSFTVSDLCPSTICACCNRGAQRCKCSSVDRMSHLCQRGELCLLKLLSDMQEREVNPPCIPPLSLVERCDGSGAAAVNDGGVAEVLNDSFEDISSCSIPHTKKVRPGCNCCLQ